MSEITSADHALSRQATEMAAVSSNPETTGILADWMVERNRIKSQTTLRCSVEFGLLEHPLWETEFCAQRPAREFGGSVLETRGNLFRDRLRARNPLKLRTHSVRGKFRLFHRTAWWAMQGSNQRPLSDMSIFCRFEGRGNVSGRTGRGGLLTPSDRP